MDFHSEERQERYVWLIVRENDGIAFRRYEGELNLAYRILASYRDT